MKFKLLNKASFIKVIFFSFRQRWNNELSLRLPQNLAKNRAASFTPEVAKHFYGVLHAKLIELDILNKSSNIWNCDESGYGSASGRKRNFCRKTDRKSNSLAPNNDKLSYTVLVSSIL